MAHKKYVPTEWKKGDVVTASKLNKIEEALVELEEFAESIKSRVDDLETLVAQEQTE